MTRLEQLKDFIRHWHESKDMGQVAEKTGMDERKCSNIAAALRRQFQVPLPTMPVRVHRNTTEFITEAQADELRRWSVICASAVEGQRRRQS